MRICWHITEKLVNFWYTSDLLCDRPVQNSTAAEETENRSCCWRLCGQASGDMKTARCARNSSIGRALTYALNRLQQQRNSRTTCVKSPQLVETTALRMQPSAKTGCESCSLNLVIDVSPEQTQLVNIVRSIQCTVCVCVLRCMHRCSLKRRKLYACTYRSVTQRY